MYQYHVAFFCGFAGDCSTQWSPFKQVHNISFKLGTQSGLLQSCNVADFPVFSVNIKGKNGYYTGQEVIYHNRIAIKTYLTQNEHTRTFLEGTQSFLFSVNP